MSVQVAAMPRGSVEVDDFGASFEAPRWDGRVLVVPVARWEPRQPVCYVVRDGIPVPLVAFAYQDGQLVSASSAIEDVRIALAANSSF